MGREDRRSHLGRLETTEERRWYVQKAIEHGWSRTGAIVVVYVAQDPELDRKGAIKVWTAEADQLEPTARLRREGLLRTSAPSTPPTVRDREGPHESGGRVLARADSSNSLLD